MTSLLTYRIRGSLGEIADFRIGGRRLTVSLPGYETGHLAIGGFSVPISGGAAELDLGLIKDGEHHPVLISGGKQIRLERFAVEGGRLLILPTEESKLRELLSRIHALERGLASAERAILEIKKEIACDTVI